MTALHAQDIPSHPETPDAVVSWPALERELDRWAAAGRQASLWWRDDDAGAPDPALDRLLALAALHDVPLALAVIPARATWTLGGRLARADAAVAVVQHGWDHGNRAPDASKQSELGDDRPAEAIAADLRAGWRRLAELFGARALPVMVPPWNRIGERTAALLPALGYVGVSTFGPRPVPSPSPLAGEGRGEGGAQYELRLPAEERPHPLPAPSPLAGEGRGEGVAQQDRRWMGIARPHPSPSHGCAVGPSLPHKGGGGIAPFFRINTHIDIIDWHGTHGFVGEAAALGAAVGHLTARREGRADPDEPTGIMTHHLNHDEACWRFLDCFLAVTRRHPGAVWPPISALFGAAPAP